MFDISDNKQNSLLGGTFAGDMNNLMTPGIYWCVFADITNGPYTSGYGWVEVSCSSISSMIQKVYRFISGTGITQIVLRGRANSQWYDWRVSKTEEYTSL